MSNILNYLNEHTQIFYSQKLWQEEKFWKTTHKFKATLFFALILPSDSLGTLHSQTLLVKIPTHDRKPPDLRPFDFNHSIIVKLS